MTEFQIVLLLATGFFIFKAFQKFQQMNDKEDFPVNAPAERPRPAHGERPQFNMERYLAEADRAYEEGDFLKALGTLERAKEEEPDNPEVLKRLGFILTQNDELEKAEGIYLHAIDVDPEDDTLHTALASLYRQQEKQDKAEEHYKEALRIDPEYEVTYFNYGNLLLDTGRREEAKTMYEKALEINPDLDQAHEALKNL